MNEPDILSKLRITLEMIDTLQQKNNSQEQSLNSLRDDNTALLKKHESLLNEYAALYQERECVEEEGNEAISQWKTKVEALTRHIEHINSTAIQEKDLEVLKMQMKMDLGAHLHSKWKIQEKELENARKACDKLRKENCTLCTEFESKTAKHEIEVCDMTQNHTDEIAHLKGVILGLQATLTDTSEIVKMRECQRLNGELSLKVHHLVAEVEEVRAAKEALKIEYEQKERVNQRKSVEMNALIKSLQVERDSLKAQIESMGTENRKIMIEIETYHQEAHNNMMELERNKAKLEEVQHQFTVELTDLKTSVIKEKTSHNNTIAKLAMESHAQQTIINTLHESLNQLQQKNSEQEHVHEEALRCVREESSKKICKLESDKVDLDAALSTYKQIKAQLEAQGNTSHLDLHNEIAQLKTQIKEVSAKLHAAVREKENHECKFNELASKLDESSRESQRNKCALTAIENDEKTAKKQAHEFENALLETRKELKLLNELVKKERASHEHNIDRYKNLIIKEKCQYKMNEKNFIDENTLLAQNVRRLQDESDKLNIKVAEYKRKIKKYKMSGKTDVNAADKECNHLNNLKKKQYQFLDLLEGEGLLDI